MVGVALLMLVPAKGVACTSDQECKGDRVCVNQVCVDPPAKCASEKECAPGEACEQGRCKGAAPPQAPPPPPSAASPSAPPAPKEVVKESYLLYTRGGSPLDIKDGIGRQVAVQTKAGVTNGKLVSFDANAVRVAVGTEERVIYLMQIDGILLTDGPIRRVVKVAQQSPPQISQPSPATRRPARSEDVSIPRRDSASGAYFEALYLGARFDESDYNIHSGTISLSYRVIDPSGHFPR